MYISRIKQFLINNLWYGEQDPRERRDEAQVVVLSSQLLMPDTSRVWGIDISHWNLPPVNLRRMIDQYGLDFVIIKGCDGSLRSRYFEQHRQNAIDCGLPWGIYDWLYPNSKVSINAQTAAWWAQYLENPPPLGVFIDAEATTYAGLPANPTAADLRMAHDSFRSRGGVSASTYTAPYYANSSLAGFDWTREELWIAHYGVTTPLLPAGAPGYTFHQFSSTLDGHALDPDGNAELDGNYFHGSMAEFESKYGLAGDRIENIFPGVQRVTGRRRQWEFSLLIIDPSRVRYEVIHPQPLTTGTHVAQQTGARIVVSGGEWDKVSRPQDYSVSNGAVYVQRVAFRPSLLVMTDGSLRIWHENVQGVKQATTGLRYLVVNGVNAIPPDGTESKYIEGHSRSIDGLDGRGFHLHLTSAGINYLEGTYPDLGLRLYEAAEIMLQYGAVTAFDEGGGGDVTEVINGILTNVPENPGGEQRSLPQFWAIYPQETPPMANYEVTTIKSNMSLRSDHNTGADKIGSLPDSGTVRPADEIWTAPADLFNSSGVKINQAGDQWAHLTQENAWIAITHLGVVYCSYTTLTPPPSTGNPVIHYSRTETFSAEGYPDKTIQTEFDWPPNA